MYSMYNFQTAVSTPTSSNQVESSETITSMFTQTRDNYQTDGIPTLSTSSTHDTLPVSSSAEICKNNNIIVIVHVFCTVSTFILSPTYLAGPSQLPALAGVSGAAVGGAIAALLILVVFAAVGVTILIVVLVRRRSVYKSTTLTSDQNTPHIENPLYTYQGTKHTWINTDET